MLGRLQVLGQARPLTPGQSHNHSDGPLPRRTGEGSLDAAAASIRQGVEASSRACHPCCSPRACPASILTGLGESM